MYIRIYQTKENLCIQALAAELHTLQRRRFCWKKLELGLPVRHKVNLLCRLAEGLGEGLLEKALELGFAVQPYAGKLYCRSGWFTHSSPGQMLQKEMEFNV